MAEWFARYADSLWSILLDLAPALLLGLFLAGLIHEFLPRRFIRRRLAADSARAVAEAALVGVPMPLCSCGVVPTAIGLRNDGASKGATTSFLISTPQTGVDSILVSATFLGWPFAFFKLAAAFVTGLLGGLLVNATTPHEERNAEKPIDAMKDDTAKTLPGKLVGAVRYAAFDLFAMIDLWLFVGILAAAVITVAVPPGYLENVAWTQGIGGMLIMLAVAMPMYVCTTSSVPIAAAMIAAGMPAGTALVFLMAGPATNIATMGMVYRALGGRVLAIYLGVVAVMTMVFGLFFDAVLGAPGAVSEHLHHHHGPGLIDLVSAVAVIGLMAFFLGRRAVNRVRSWNPAPVADDELAFAVEGMSCVKCVAKVKDAATHVPGVVEADVQLAGGRLVVKGNAPPAAVMESVRKAGYKIGPAGA